MIIWFKCRYSAPPCLKEHRKWWTRLRTRNHYHNGTRQGLHKPNTIYWTSCKLFLRIHYIYIKFIFQTTDYIHQAIVLVFSLLFNFIFDNLLSPPFIVSYIFFFIWTAYLSDWIWECGTIFTVQLLAFIDWKFIGAFPPWGHFTLYI